MLVVLIGVLVVALWGLWNLYVQTQRFNELLAHCEQTVTQLRRDALHDGEHSAGQDGPLSR